MCGILTASILIDEVNNLYCCGFKNCMFRFELSIIYMSGFLAWIKLHNDVGGNFNIHIWECTPAISSLDIGNK